MKVLVIGELCVDKFIYGSVTRLCPEAPVPILNPIETIENKGMSGNVVENLKSLYDDLEVVHWHQTEKIEKIRFVEKKSNHIILRVDEGELNPIIGLDFLSPEKRRTISESDIVIISDYNKGYLKKQIISEISKLSKFTIMDSKKVFDAELIENLTLIKVNELEYKNNNELINNNKDKFIITLGSRGVMYNDIIYPSKNPQETIDVSGAGDTFVSAFSLKYFITKSIPQSIEYANDVCSNVVSKKGVAVPDMKFKIIL